MREHRIKLDSCPLNFYCLKDSSVNKIGVCNGETGNYRDCSCYKHYTEESLERHGRVFDRPINL